MSLSAYDCRVAGFESGSVLHAETASKARYRYFLQLDGCISDLKITQIQVHSLGAPRTDEGFLKTARYRGVPFARIGMAVEVDGDKGLIVGKNSSANFNILMKSGTFNGQVMNCHPDWRMRFYGPDGVEIGGAA